MNMNMNNINMNNMNNINRYITPVNIDSTKKILFQMSNCICKIYNNNIISNGFFCKIPYNNIKINVLITTYQAINENYFYNNNQINLFINDYNEQKIINYNPTRKIYYNKIYNITIIEINEYDNINNYLEIDDDNLFRININSYYENKSIYILHFLENEKASVSYGFLNQLFQYNINHTCYTESTSNGGPILNLSNNKLIGLTLYNNQGIILKFPIEDFINNYKNQQMFNNNNMINNNNMNLGMVFPNMMINNNMMMNNNFGMLNNNMMINNNNEINNQKPKINAIFNTATGTSLNIKINYGKTMEELFIIYMKRIGKPELIGCNDRLFLFNAGKIEWKDKTPVEVKLADLNPVIVVYYTQNCVNLPYIVKFQSTMGSKWELSFDYYDMPMDLVLTKFLEHVGKPELKKEIPKKICFLYNAQQIKPGEKRRIGEFFKDNYYPKVVVNDMNNLLG